MVLKMGNFKKKKTKVVLGTYPKTETNSFHKKNYNCPTLVFSFLKDG
jgi:hypothetical protein